MNAGQQSNLLTPAEFVGGILQLCQDKRGNAYDAKGERNRAVAEYQKAVQSGIDYDNAQAVAKKYLATPYDPKAEQTAIATPGF